MLISVCIVNWNTRDYLRECLTALYRYPPRDARIEVIVVDNASSDDSAAMVGAEFPDALLIANDQNLGYAEGNNQALRRAAGDYLLLLNPDVIVHKDCLTRTLLFMHSHPNTGALSCRLIGTDGKTQSTLRSFPDPGPVLFEYLGLSRIFPRSRLLGAYRMTYFDYARVGEADQPMGSFLMIPRTTLDQVGLLDTDFPIFFNEVDWCYRAKREHGWKIYYTPEATATHYGPDCYIS
jgi:GT2 family glycosyltransferase